MHEHSFPTRRSSDLTNYLFLLPGLLLFLVIIIIPFIINIAYSFTEWSGAGPSTFVGFDNYVRAVTDGKFWISFYNNLLLIVAMVIVPTILGIVLAIMLFEVLKKGPLRRAAGVFRACLYVPQIIAIVVSAVAWKWLLNPSWGALNYLLKSLHIISEDVNWLGDSSIAIYSIMALMTWYQIGYALVVFVSALERLNPEILESAAIDGAPLRTVVRAIILPQITFEISVVVLTTLIAAFKVFGPVYAMTKGGPGDSTSVFSFYSYKSFFERSQVGYGSTVSTIIAILIMLVTFVFIWYRNKRENEVVGI
jgi:raffinose/stachyose/melibiose transport system permease protein